MSRCARRFQTYDEIVDAVRVVCRNKQLPIPEEEAAEDAEFASEYSFAQSLVALGRPEEAIAKLRQVAEKWPNASEVFTELGRAYLAEHKFDEALIATERSLEIYPYSTAAWNNLGGILANQHKSDEVRNAYSKALLIDPENTGAMVGLAQLLIEKGELAEARKACELALYWRPEKPLVLLVASECLMRQKETRRAAACLEKLVLLKSDNWRTPWFNLALCRHDLGDADGYVKALQEVVKSNPKDGEALNFLVQALLDVGRMDEAIATCETLQQVEGWGIVGVCKQAQLLAAKGAGMSAYLLLNKWTEKHERSAALWFTMAIILGQGPAQYRRQALTAAENALLCYNQNPKQLTPENCRVLKDLIADLSARR